MYVSLVGVNHRTAPVEVRERFAFAADELPRALVRLREEFKGAVILSTCNRTEVYIVAPTPLADAWPVVKVLSELKDACGRHIDLFYAKSGEDAARHLFRVAAGLDSMVLGEAEILGQVRAAFVAAGAAGSGHPLLSRLFHTAIRTGRRARAETAIGREPVSVSSVVATLARKMLGDLSGRCVLVVGTGEAGGRTAHSLVENGVSRLLVMSRTHERAEQLAADLRGEAVPFDALPTALSEADIVITSSGAPSFLIGPDLLAPAAARRDGQPLLFIDIAVPRDVDPVVEQFPHVRLYDIDDLQAISQESIRAREREVAAVDAVIEGELRRFVAWWRTLSVVPTLRALQHRAEVIRQYELERTLPRLGSLTKDERRRLEAMTRAIVNKLLHPPIASLKSGNDGAERAAALQELFDLEPAVES
jgi:glutamyl-tRNA reductase